MVSLCEVGLYAFIEPRIPIIVFLSHLDPGDDANTDRFYMPFIFIGSLIFAPTSASTHSHSETFFFVFSFCTQTTVPAIFLLYALQSSVLHLGSNKIIACLLFMWFLLLQSERGLAMHRRLSFDWHTTQISEEKDSITAVVF